MLQKLLPLALTRTSVALLMLSGAITTRAQLVGDSTTLILNGTPTNIVGFLTIGNTGPNTTLIVTNAGNVTAGSVGIGGNTTSTNNLVAVSGAGSRMTTPGGGAVFRVGQGSANNRLVISQGGAVTTAFGVIGFPVAASNNTALVTGNGSAWTNGNLYVGEGGSGNSLVVSSGGRVVAGTSEIGLVAGGSNNFATVTGPGSTWTTTGNLIVGDADGNNRLFVNNGGSVTAGSGLTLGDDATSQGNLLSVAAGTATATNASGTGALDVRRGTVEFNDGLITADRLLVTNAQGSFTFNGGTLITRGATINNGQDFVVGANAGTGPAGAIFANITTTTIPSVGAATPYPSVINVANLGGVITKITVTLSNLSHTYPDDLDILLVGPAGQKVMLMSDAGDTGDLIDANLSFANDAVSLLPDSTTIASGTYRPTDYDLGDLLPQPAPAGSYSTNLATFNGASPNGAWSLYISDDAGGDFGSLGAWSLNIVTTPASATLANGVLITINDNASATPYPSVINVTNLAGVVSRVTVTVSNFTHTSSYDVDLLLVNPAGAAVALMRDAGSGGVTGVTMKFDDAAPSLLPYSGSIASGTYRPTTYFITESLPSPAPAEPYATELATFNGSNPNGDWSLFVSDHISGFSGAINNGWSLHLETITPATWDVRSNATPTTVSGLFIIGNNAPNATLLITNGATLTHSGGFMALGREVASSHNRVVISSPGSTLNNLNSALYVGNRSGGNLLVVSNGATAANGDGYIGDNPTSGNNLAIVTGANALWTNSIDLTVGDSGSGNQLVVSNGAVVANGIGILGFNLGANNNVAVVTGTNSAWNNRGELRIGDSGSFNTLLITDGGKVSNTTGRIGFNGDNNAVTVSGSGSAWNNSASLSVGSFGGGNRLLVSSGAVVSATNVFVGAFPSILGNRLTVDGGTLRVTNASGTAVFDVRRGTNVLNAGVIEVDNLKLTNAAGFFEFNGGSLNARSVTVANGTTFIVGHGINPTSYRMSGILGDNHFFVNGVHISSSATLSGQGTISGTLTVQSGGTVSPGSSFGKIILFSPPALQGNVVMEIGKSGATLTNDLITVIGSLGYGGSLTVSNLGPTALALGDSFQLFNATSHTGAFSSISLPALPSNLSWSNQLLVNGTITIVPAPLIISSVSKSTTNLIFNVANGSAGGTWKLLAATNVTLPMANWITNKSGVFDGLGNVTITNGIISAEPQRFYRIKVP